MPTKSLSSPREAAYPLLIRKTLVAPGDTVAAGAPLYELEDRMGQRFLVHLPMAGRELIIVIVILLVIGIARPLGIFDYDYD